MEKRKGEKRTGEERRGEGEGRGSGPVIFLASLTARLSSIHLSTLYYCHYYEVMFLDNGKGTCIRLAHLS